MRHGELNPGPSQVCAIRANVRTNGCVNVLQYRKALSKKSSYSQRIHFSLPFALQQRVVSEKEIVSDFIRTRKTLVTHGCLENHFSPVILLY